MQFIKTGNLNLNKKILFDVYRFAVYLQITDLQQLCLDYFTFNLSCKNVKKAAEFITRLPVFR